MIKYKVGITGASGILGKKVYNYFVSKGADVSVLTRDSKKINNHKRVKIFEVDLQAPDINKIKNFINGLDLLFHLASELKDESKMVATNYEGTKILADQLLGKKTLFVYTSSIGVFDYSKSRIIKESGAKKQINLYEKTKFLSEQYLFKLKNENELNFVILRPSIILDFEMKSKIIDNFINLNYLNIGLKIPKSVVLNFILSKDVVDALLKLSQQKKAIGKAFNLSSNISLNAFTLEIEKLSCKKIYYRLPFKLLLILIKLKYFFAVRKNDNSLKSFFSNVSRVSSEKIQNSINIKIDENYFEFLKLYIEQKK
ncbi:MAG: NAD-dependent epimerase/dehydratase family protein [Flavobacteriaceae bacterium]